MVKITRQLSKGHEQLRVTIPVQVARALGWNVGDNLKVSVHRGGMLFRKVG